MKNKRKRPFFRQKGLYNEISIRKVNFQCSFRENDLFFENKPNSDRKNSFSMWIRSNFDWKREL